MKGEAAYNVFRQGGGDSQVLPAFCKLHKVTQARWARVEESFTPTEAPAPVLKKKSKK